MPQKRSVQSRIAEHRIVVYYHVGGMGIGGGRRVEPLRLSG